MKKPPTKIALVTTLFLLCIFLLSGTACGKTPAIKSTSTPTPTPSPTPASNWSVRYNSYDSSIFEVMYRSNSTASYQYAALHTQDSYFRLVYGPQSGWGTSVVLMPPFWEKGAYYQGAKVSYTYKTDGADFVLSLKGQRANLSADIEVRILPPSNNSITAIVNVTTSGQVNLDTRAGEAFKLLMLSSMNIYNSSQWDTQLAYVDSATFAIPKANWIINPAVTSRRFGLLGGSSSWKPNAPTIEINMDRDASVTGWVTYTTNPNDDNIGFWGAVDYVPESWSYTITARP